MDPLIARNREEILSIARRHGVGSVKIFGSFARGEARPDSDIDFLIEVTGKPTPWFPGGLLADLEELLGRRVDVVTSNALHPELKEGVLRDAVPL